MDPRIRRVPGRLPQAVRPVAYDLVLEIDPDAPRFQGEVRIHVDVQLETDTVNLHARGVQLGRVEARLPSGSVHPATLKPAVGPHAEPDYGEVELTFAARLPRGPCELYLAFEAPFDAQLSGLYRVREGGRWYAFTQFEAADARKCFPCFDEPGFKTPYAVTLIVPEGQQAFANGPEVSRTREPATRGAPTDRETPAAPGAPTDREAPATPGAPSDRARTRIRFADTPPLPTYLLAFAVGPLEVVDVPAETTPPMRILVPAGKAALAGTAAEFTPGILRVLEDYFGRPYPYEKLDLVAVPEFGAGAMENAGLITFREELLLADPATLTRSRARTIAEVIAHEVAHHWFGNLVTMSWWEDLWLNEAFATWMAAKAVDTWRPSFDQVMELLQVRTRVMATDALPAARKVRQPVATVGEAEQAFDDLTYYKGAAILTMLERWVGEDAFRDGVRRYLDHHQWGNATAADLFSHLDAATGRDVSGVARSFLDQPGVPMVSIEHETGRARLRQAPYALLGLEAPSKSQARWRIPVHLGESWRLLEEADTDAPVTGGEARHPNLGEWSYYRWRLEPGALTRLAEGSADLDVRSRLGILDNAWAAVAAGRLEVGVYLQVLESLRGATERPLVEELVGGVSRIQDVWEDLAEHRGYQRLVTGLLGAHGERLGLAPRDGENEDDAILRPEVVHALAYLGRDPHHLEEAAARGLRWLDDPAAVPADLAPVCVALAAWSGRASLDALTARLEGASEPEARLACLRGLGMLSGEDLERALDLTLSERVRAQDFHYVFRGAMSRAPTREGAFAWFTRHYDAVRARQPEFTFVHMGRIVGQFRTERGLDHALAFFASHTLPGGERAVQQGAERARHLIALRAAGGAALADHLNRRTT